MQKNIVYGSITAGGDVHIGDKIYVIERDFSCSILFLRIEKDDTGHKAMLWVKGPDDASLHLLNEWVYLPVGTNLFEQVSDFQSLRRGVEQSMRMQGLHRPSAQTLESTLSRAIYKSFFAGDIGLICTDFLQLLQTSKIRDLLLVISTEDEQVQNLPWEMILPYLNIGNHALPRDSFGLIRSRETSLRAFNRQGPIDKASPIKLLFIPALPENLTEREKMLEIEDEQRKIIEAVSGLEATGSSQPKLVMEILDCASLSEITEALEKRSHDIVHISGHGAYVESLKKGILCLEDEDGNEQEVTGQALGEALRAFSSVKLLVLSACETAVGGPDGSTAEQMAAVGLPAVLAMRFSVTDAGAKMFTEKLYERLAYGDSLTKAMHDARLRLWDYVHQCRADAAQVDTPAEWFTPVLYQNQVIGSLIAPSQYDTDTLNRFYPKIDFIKGRHTRLIGAGFIGRKRLMIRLRQCFEHGKPVCLHGLGGLGKTTTAEAFASLHRTRHGYGIESFQGGSETQEDIIIRRLFDKWKSHSQPDEFMAQRLLAQLESSTKTVDDKLQLLIDNCLSKHRNILIFDNFEDVQTQNDCTQQQQIVSDGLRSFLRYLLQNAPEGCHILFTTRYFIADLADLVTHLPVDKMTYAEQYRYLNFSDILRKLSPDERAIVNRRIDGHPRALEFLEGQLRREPAFDLIRFDIEVGKVETRVFEDLLLNRLLSQLSDQERTIFITASVFFTRTPVTALEAVLKVPASELGPVLTTLQNWSLCFWDETSQMLEVHALTRAWLRTQNLPESPEFKAISQRAGEFFQQRTLLDEAILTTSYFEQAESWDDYAESAFWIESHYQRIGLYPLAYQLNTAVLEKNLSLFQNARALNNMGLLSLSQGNHSAGIKYFQQSLRMFQEISDQKGIAASLGGIGQILCNWGEHEKAWPYFQQSLIIQGSIEDKRGEGATLLKISQIHDIRGEYDEASACLHKSLHLRRETGDRAGEGSTLNDMALIACRQANYSMALSCAEESLKIRYEIGDVYCEALTLNVIGGIYFLKGEYDIALDYYQQGLNIQYQVKDKYNQCKTLINISSIYWKRKDYDTALSYLQGSLIVVKEIGDKQGEGATLHNIGNIYESKGDYVAALSYLKQSLSIRQQTGDKQGEGATLHNIGNIYRAQRNYQAALCYLQDSLNISQKIGDRQGIAFSWYITGCVYFEQNALSTAFPLLMKFCQLFETIGIPEVAGPESYLNEIHNRIGKVRFDQLYKIFLNSSKP